MTNPKKKSSRIAAAATMAVCMLAAFAALGGVDRAQSAVSSAQGAYGKKVTICHKGKKTISVGKSAWAAHKRHGDTLGSCSSAAAKKAKKAKKAKADKARAEHRKAEHRKAEHKKAEHKKAEHKKAEHKKAEHKKAEHEKADEKKKDGESERGEKPGKGKGRGK